MIIERYLRRELWRGYALIALILVGLFSLLELVQQIDDIDKGSYSLIDALTFVALTIPGRLVNLLLMVVLLGTAVGLGMMANSQEIVASRALGASVGRIARTVVGASTALIVIAVFSAQFLVPRLDQAAYLMRAARTAEQAALDTSDGFWARDGWQFLNIREFRFGRIPIGIDLYYFDPEQGLVRFIHAKSAEIVEDNRWRFNDAWEKVVVGTEGETIHHDVYYWDSFLSAEQMGSISMPPESLAPTDLWQYIAELKERGQSYDRYELALWRQLVMPVGVLVMALLAVPIGFSTRRSSQAAKKVFQATTLGLVFFLLNETAGYIGLLAQAPAVLTTLAPIVILGIVAVVMLGRIE
ncbi:MAG: LPS export ABC transporter permease LptG [Xanthomonadales bacterium]|jgi:lipopolysaccharide export system permease protein|nr:LPS export ABC transporter permease LptG [Xanthomonadales bacterium]